MKVISKSFFQGDSSRLPFSAYAKFSVKIKFCVHLKGLEILIFQKMCVHTTWMIS